MISSGSASADITISSAWPRFNVFVAKKFKKFASPKLQFWEKNVPYLRSLLSLSAYNSSPVELNPIFSALIRYSLKDKLWDWHLHPSKSSIKSEFTK